MTAPGPTRPEIATTVKLSGGPRDGMSMAIDYMSPRIRFDDAGRTGLYLRTETTRVGERSFQRYDWQGWDDEQ